ncbi:MAG: NAD(P)-dependent alcohol dehydrogenase [Desulfobacterales bacterium]|jgi:NADPH:quinone reductase-like Zn-dependent oxidoreductase
MKAATIIAFGDIDQIQMADIDRPQIKPNEVLVRVRAAAINPKDTFIRKGRFKAFTGEAFPMQTGFDFAGEIAETGADTQWPEIGAAVYGMLDGWEGRCCAEFMAADPLKLASKPQGLAYEEAAAIPLAASTALQALRDQAGIKAGDRVCVNGAAGGVGSMAVQIAKIFAAEVTAISSAANHDFLTSLGADHCIDYARQDVTRLGRAFDIFFDVFGNQPFAAISPILQPKGIWVSTVLQPHVFESVEATQNSPGKKAKMVIVEARREDLSQIRGWVDAGRLKAVIHAVYPLERIAEAHAQQETKHTRGKLVIRID